MHKRFETAVFSTAPQSADCASAGFVDETIRVAQMSEAAGCTGILVYTDNRLVDPWLVSQLIIQNTQTLCPLVAIQPVYMHPYTVAKLIASYAYMYGRRIYLNMVAGGFKNDLIALNDNTPHDKRYDRLVEYTKIILGLCEHSRSGRAFSFAGEFYKVDALKLTPAVPEELTPGVFVSGSSEAGVAAGRALGATIVQYPKQVSEYSEPLPKDGFNYGIRIGVVTRAAGDEAWRTARERFPEDRRGQLTHQLAMRVTDSHWHKQLSDLSANAVPGSPYWMNPFENYKTFCPYLVGDYDAIAAEITRYTDVGYNTFILDIPPSLDELRHIAEAFGRVPQRASA